MGAHHFQRIRRSFCDIKKREKGDFQQTPTSLDARVEKKSHIFRFVPLYKGNAWEGPVILPRRHLFFQSLLSPQSCVCNKYYTSVHKKNIFPEIRYQNPVFHTTC
eukprot:GEMP01073428.1.p2 GENE.GEMP01073428.1~~GEMP01073428.1.p2  ORF type:complete len:105 (+),score=2.51 GEMP01073428.1:581-895(+)